MPVGEIGAWSRLEPADTGLSFAVPDATEIVSDDPLMLVLASEDGTRPVICANAEPLPAEVGLAEWVEREVGGQLGALEGAALIAREPAQLLDRPAELTLLSYVQEGRAFTLVQWWARAGDAGVVLSATCVTPLYPRLAEMFARIAREVQFDGAL